MDIFLAEQFSAMMNMSVGTTSVAVRLRPRTGTGDAEFSYARQADGAAQVQVDAATCRFEGRLHRSLPQSMLVRPPAPPEPPDTHGGPQCADCSWHGREAGDKGATCSMSG